MPNSHTLLIWEEVPESTKLYLIPNKAIDGDSRMYLHLAHGHYINAKVSEEAELALLCINAALVENPEHLHDEHPPGSKWAQRWVAYKQDPKTALLDVHITHVYRCGFLL